MPITKPKVYQSVILNHLDFLKDLVGYPKTEVTEPKSTGVKRVIDTTGAAIIGPAESVVSDSIDMCRAAQPAWIAGREGSVEGVGGQDAKPALAKAVGHSAVRMKNQPPPKSLLQSTTIVGVLLACLSMSSDEKRVVKNAGPPKSQEQLELKGANSSGGAQFKSDYPSSHGDSSTQFAVSKEPRGEQKEAELPTFP